MRQHQQQANCCQRQKQQNRDRAQRHWDAAAVRTGRRHGDRLKRRRRDQPARRDGGSVSHECLTTRSQSGFVLAIFGPQFFAQCRIFFLLRRFAQLLREDVVVAHCGR